MQTSIRILTVLQSCFIESCSRARGQFDMLNESVISFIMEPKNSLTLVNLVGMCGAPYEEDTCQSRLFMREMSLVILYHFSEINGYGKFITENCMHEMMQMLAESMFKAK